MLLDDLFPRTAGVGGAWFPTVDQPDDDPIPRAAEGAPPSIDAGAKRVLLLEDDVSFREVIKAFLTEAGYTVVEAQSGVEGIREVLACDFAVIVCDMMMPGLAGDLFYRAVERARPRLCERFIFMTGRRGDSTANDFIKTVNGHALIKPFRLDRLIEAIDGLGARSQAIPKTLPRRDETFPSAPLVSSPPSQPRGDSGKTAAAPATACSHLAVGYREQRNDASSATGDYNPREFFGLRRLPRIRTGIVVAICAAMASAFFMVRRSTIETRCEMLSADLAKVEREWAGISKEMEGAERAREAFQELLSLPKRVEQDRARPRWTWALRSVAVAGRDGIELQDIHARQVDGAPGACEFRTDGFSFGRDARATADSFRLKIEQELQQGESSVPAKTGFLRFADVPESASVRSNQQRVTFEIVATVGIKDPVIFERAIKY